MYPKTADLILRLADRTEEGRVSWESTADDDVYQAAFPNYSVTVAEVPDFHHPEPDYVVTILNDEGKIVERVSHQDLAGHIDLGENQSVYRLLMNMFMTARGYALGVGRAVDEIMQELGEDPDDPNKIPF